MKNQFLILVCAILPITTVITSCKKEINEAVKTEPQNSVLKKEIPLKTKNGMLVFNSFRDLNLKSNELNMLSDSDLSKFESSFGIKTAEGIFREVLRAEDSLSNYYQSLTAEQQSYWLTQPQKYSKAFELALTKGVLKKVQDKDGTQYYDINLCQKSYSTVLNVNGFVQVDTLIIQYTGNSIKLIKNGDFNLIEKLNGINTDYEDEVMMVQVMSTDPRLKHAMSNNWTTSPNDWIITDWNIFGTPIKRIRVWIDGHSEPYGSYSLGCAQYMQCTHVVRAEAMKKNFWGTWIYGDYNPSFSFSSSWQYKYVNYSCDPYITYGCGVYSCEHNNDVGSDSPYSNSWPTVNNASINLLPTGIWSGTYWFHSAFWTEGYLSATLDGHSFYFSW